MMNSDRIIRYTNDRYSWRFDQDGGRISEHAIDGFPDVGIEVDRVNQLDVGARRQLAHRLAQSVQGSPEILTPVSGDEKQLTVGVQETELRFQFRPKGFGRS